MKSEEKGRCGAVSSEKKKSEMKYETFPVIKSRLLRAALLSLSALSIINAAAAFICWCVNANTSLTRAHTHTYIHRHTNFDGKLSSLFFCLTYKVRFNAVIVAGLGSLTMSRHKHT